MVAVSRTRGAQLMTSTSVLDVGARALLDALPDAAAVLDRSGRIVEINHAWRMFALDNGGDLDQAGVGVSYVDVCRRSAAAGCADAAVVLASLEAVLGGTTVESDITTVESDMEYSCPAPLVVRWFVLRITPLAGPCPGALVAHTNVSRRKLAEQEMARMAAHDALTGLANRSQLVERLRTALTPRAQVPDVGVLYLDLDGFKPVNDTFGHAAGDEVLRTVAGRLSASVRPQDTVARVGGDEFVVVAPRISRAGLDALAARVGAALAVSHLVHGTLVQVGASVGIHLASPAEDALQALGQADAAMYEVKRARRPHLAGRASLLG